MSRSASSSPYQDYINRAEDFADQILRHSKHVLPHLARFCLVSTFFEDGVRMWFQWGEQRDYFSQTWNCSTVFGVLFVLFNLFGQLGGVAMILARQKVEIAVALLGTVVVVQVCMLNKVNFSYIACHNLVIFLLYAVLNFSKDSMYEKDMKPYL